MADSKLYESICNEMEEKNYTKVEHVFSAAEASSYGLLVPLPIMALMGVIYYFRWKSMPGGFDFMFFFVGLILTTVIHELIHGLGWSLFAEKGFRSMKFGITQGMPYCHCVEVLGKRGYITGTMAPVVVIGTVLMVLSLIIPSFNLFVLALINVLSAGGDMLIILRARTLKDAHVIDHPSLPGFVAFEK